MSTPATAPRQSASPLALGAVLVGGAVGTSARLGVDAAVPHTLDAFALSTLIVNVIGALLLGLTVGALWSRLPHWGRAGLGAGILGSFTTFSALTNSIIALALAGDVFTALITVGLHLALGLAAAFAGLELGSRASGGRARTQTIDEVDE